MIIESLKNLEGFIYAYIAWRIVDETGQNNKAGHYIHIADLWIHEKYRGLKVLDLLIERINSHESTSQAPYIYWRNDKRNRKTPLYEKKDILRIVGTRKEMVNA